MLDKEAQAVHKYNVASWLQDVERQIKEQRAVVAKIYVEWTNSKPENKEYMKQACRKQTNILQNLYSSRLKLDKEQEELNSNSEANKATKLFTFPLHKAKA